MSRNHEDNSLLSGGVSAGVLLDLTAPTDRWYVAHTRSRNEKMVAKRLARMAVFHYLPLTERVTRSAATGRVSRSLVPVFPGYLFFNGTEEQRYQALTTNRIANILDVPNQEQLVVELLNVQFLLANTQEFSVARRLRVGDWGRVIAGPLRGLEGVVTRFSGVLRVTMNVTILGQSVSVEVDSAILERIDPPSFTEAGMRSRRGRGQP